VSKSALTRQIDDDIGHQVCTPFYGRLKDPGERIRVISVDEEGWDPEGIAQVSAVNGE
jgi:hypothetical protein